LPERIVIPSEDQKGLNAYLAQHFGRAPYYTIVDIDKNGTVLNVKAVENKGEHFGGIGEAHSHLLELKQNAIIAYGMGPRGLLSFQNAGIAVLKANADTVNEVVTAYKEDKLQELTEGCEHAHHH
jgi:predicted Fe-Mo cluster-binding NifX family protein